VEIFITAKNTDPSNDPDPILIVYLGCSFDDAVEAVGGFYQYETVDYPSYGYIPSVLPSTYEQDLIRYYKNDGLWYSIVSAYIY